MNWISKNYNKDTVKFLKDNFNLTEIVSKLIAIRKIKLEEVELFLNPKIKNLLPNPFILKGMEKAVTRTVEAIKNTNNITVKAYLHLPSFHPIAPTNKIRLTFGVTLAESFDDYDFSSDDFRWFSRISLGF